MIELILILIFLPNTFALDCEFYCNDSGMCVRSSRVCNGRNDCQDGSDESNCQNWNCTSGYTKCQDNLQCIRDGEMCDGFRTNCKDKSDENQENCLQHECQELFIKCRNGWQCVPQKNFCDKTKRGQRQYDCLDKSDETIWGCQNVGRNCSDSENLWPCGSSDNELCISVNKVCDGRSDLSLNNCDKGQDEDHNFCRDDKT